MARNHEYKTCAELTTLLKRYGLPSSGLKAVLLARLTAHEATLASPPFIAITQMFSFDFLKLPNEIRNMVYKELFTPKSLFFWRAVSVLRANKQVYSEAKGLLYSLNTIKIEIDTLDRLWLGHARTHFNIGMPPKQHYSDNDRSKGFAPPIQWLKLPTNLEMCERIKVVLAIKSYYHQRLTSVELNTMLMHFNSLVYTKLMKHEHLHTITVELEVTGEYNAHPNSTVTDQQMGIFEKGCLESLGRLRGMREVHLKGFTFVDPFDVFLSKRAMLLPSSKWWKSFLTIPKMMQVAPQWWQLRNLSKCNHPTLDSKETNKYTRHSLQPYRTLCRYYSQSRRRHFHGFSETCVA